MVGGRDGGGRQSTKCACWEGGGRRAGGVLGGGGHPPEPVPPRIEPVSIEKRYSPSGSPTKNLVGQRRIPSCRVLLSGLYRRYRGRSAPRHLRVGGRWGARATSRGRVQEVGSGWLRRTPVKVGGAKEADPRGAVARRGFGESPRELQLIGTHGRHLDAEANAVRSPEYLRADVSVTVRRGSAAPYRARRGVAARALAGSAGGARPTPQPSSPWTCRLRPPVRRP